MDSAMPSLASNNPPSDRTNRISGFLGVLAAIAITVGLTFALHARVALSEAPPPRGPLPVEATVYTLQQSYSRPSTFLGTVTAGRKSTLAFEVGGTLAIAPPREGSVVAKGDVIAQLDQSSLIARRDAAQAQLAQADAELKLAQIKKKRQRNLRDTGAVSKEAYDESRLSAQALTAAVAAASAQLRSLEVDLEKSTLRAPYSGVIADRYVYDATVLNPGTAVVRLVETSDKEVQVGVPVKHASQLEVGKVYKLTLRDAPVKATLLGVRPDINPATRSATAIFQLQENTAALDGEPALLQLDTKVTSTGGWLPIGALLEGKRGIWTVITLVPRAEGYFAQREAVEVLDVQGDSAYVRGSLGDGAQVVASGVHRINPGSIVALSKGR
ncbi:MAG: efflux RND transporter periplasmic adaptor subunit [Halioglobus sp.]